MVEGYRSSAGQNKSFKNIDILHEMVVRRLARYVDSQEESHSEDIANKSNLREQEQEAGKVNGVQEVKKSRWRYETIGGGKMAEEAEKGLGKIMVREKSNRGMIEKKAYELFEQRGKEHGRDLDDWFEAERVVNEKKKKK